MRQLAFLFAALTLSACGGAAGSGRQAPTLTLPLAVPDGAAPVIVDYLEVCSAALEDVARGVAVLQRREGWTMDPSQAAQMAMAGQFSAVHDETGAQLVIMPTDYPHMTLVSCLLNAFPDGGAHDPADFSPDVLGRIEGLMGEASTVSIGNGETVTSGRYSGVAPNGDIIVLSVTLVPRYSRVFMGRSTEQFPETPKSK